MDPYNADAPRELPPAILLPPWMDPGYALAMSRTSFRTITTTANALAQLLDANPNRWAFGLIRGSAAPGTLKFSPWPSALTLGISATSPNVFYWYNLFTYGPMVSYQWNYVSTGVEVFQVAEVILNGL